MNTKISPDQHVIGCAQTVFFADRSLKRVAATGGPSQVLTALDTQFFGGSWAGDGNIYVGIGDEGIWRAAGKTHHTGGRRGTCAAAPARG